LKECALNHIDVKILNELPKRNRIGMKELDEKVHFSGRFTPVSVEKLENEGLTQRYIIKANKVKVECLIHT
jgi:DNA-binding Lrp family transcriptional regulator